MDGDFITLAFVAFTFLLAGFIKGVIGLGLPTVAIGLLSLLMTPAQAAALLTGPTIITNIWQAIGPRLGILLRRLWPLLAGICFGNWLGAGLLVSQGGDRTLVALGVVLVIYAIVGLTAVRFSVPAHTEPWLAPVIGVMTGVVSAATGVFGIPAVAYLQALDLDKNDLVQALGISFTISAIALAAVLARDGALPPSIAGASLLALGPALLGMWLGQKLCARMRPEVFRICFLVGLLLLGAHLALRGLL
jgi:uncharacterized membrane protein YfcA